MCRHTAREFSKYLHAFLVERIYHEVRGNPVSVCINEHAHAVSANGGLYGLLSAGCEVGYGEVGIHYSSSVSVSPRR